VKCKSTIKAHDTRIAVNNCLCVDRLALCVKLKINRWKGLSEVKDDELKQSSSLLQVLMARDFTQGTTLKKHPAL
jgi:hypothetical protein